MNRRGFLKLSLAGTAIAVLPAIAPPAQALEAAAPLVEREEMFGVLRLVTSSGLIDFDVPRRCWLITDDTIFCKYDTVIWEATHDCVVTAIEIHFGRLLMTTVWRGHSTLHPGNTLTVDCGARRES